MHDQKFCTKAKHSGVSGRQPIRGQVVLNCSDDKDCYSFFLESCPSRIRARTLVRLTVVDHMVDCAKQLRPPGASRLDLMLASHALVSRDSN
jgi:hypothetical protein